MKKVLICLMALMASVYSWGDVTCIQDGGTLYFSYSGSGSSELPSTGAWDTYTNRNTTVTAIVIGEGITSIASSAFSGFYELVSVTVPSSLTSIGTTAFGSCSKTTEIHAPNPNMWASISFGGQTSTPFGANPSPSISTTRKFYFYGSATPTSELYFTPGLTCINQYAFYNAQNITRVCVPASVGEIQSHALDCHMQYFVTLRTAAMTLGTNKPLTFKTGGKSYLYLPNGANNAYKNNSKFYDGDQNTEEGASNIGYDNKDAGATTWGTGNYVYPLSGTTGDLNWEIIQNTGTLRIYGNGSASSIGSGSASNPWYRFTLLIDKVEIEGNGGTVNHIYNNLQYFPALREIKIIQSTMPNINSDGINASLRHNEGIRLEIPVATFLDGSATNLSSTAPWNGMKRVLSGTATISDGADNTALLSALHDNLTEPFDLQINRQLANGIYNTFCSPVAISADAIEDIWGAGTALYEMSTTIAEPGEEGDVVMDFTEATSVVAGKPYLIKRTPADEEDIVTSFTIENINPEDIVTEPSSVSNGDITFYGTLAPRDVTDEEATNKSFIILTGTVTEDGQLLTYANGGTLGGMRAYWIMDTPAGAPMRRPVLRIGQSTTAIETVSDEQLALSGKKIMRNGQLFIVRGEKMYNMQGQLIK